MITFQFFINVFFIKKLKFKVTDGSIISKTDYSFIMNCYLDTVTLSKYPELDLLIIQHYLPLKYIKLYARLNKASNSLVNQIVYEQMDYLIDFLNDYNEYKRSLLYPDTSLLKIMWTNVYQEKNFVEYYSKRKIINPFDMECIKYVIESGEWVATKLMIEDSFNNHGKNIYDFPEEEEKKYLFDTACINNHLETVEFLHSRLGWMEDGLSNIINLLEEIVKKGSKYVDMLDFLKKKFVNDSEMEISYRYYLCLAREFLDFYKDQEMFVRLQDYMFQNNEFDFSEEESEEEPEEDDYYYETENEFDNSEEESEEEPDEGEYHDETEEETENEFVLYHESESESEETEENEMINEVNNDRRR